MNLQYFYDALWLYAKYQDGEGYSVAGTADNGDICQAIPHNGSWYSCCKPSGQPDLPPYFDFDGLFGDGTRVRLRSEPPGEPSIEVIQGNQKELPEQLQQWLKENFSIRVLPIKLVAELAAQRLDASQPTTKRAQKVLEGRADALENHLVNIEDAEDGLRAFAAKLWPKPKS